MHPRASLVCKALSAIVIVGLVSAGTASATVKKKPAPPKPVCGLVTSPMDPNSLDSNLDIISADVASNATMLTTAIRVASLGAWPDTKSPLGRQWTISFTIDTHLVTVTVTDGPFGVMSSYPAKSVTLDTTAKEIRFSIPINKLSDASATPAIRNGKSILTKFSVSTNETVQGPDASPVLRGGTLFGVRLVDTAVSAKKYIAGTPSCLKVGT